MLKLLDLYCYGGLLFCRNTAEELEYKLRPNDSRLAPLGPLCVLKPLSGKVPLSARKVSRDPDVT